MTCLLYTSLQSDLDNLYNLGVGLATAGAGNLGDALLPESMFHNLLSGKVSEIAILYDHYSGLFEEAEQGIGNLLLDKIGGPDNVACLFAVSYTHLDVYKRQAFGMIQKSFAGAKWFIEGDIKGFFDNCLLYTSIAYAISYI